MALTAEPIPHESDSRFLRLQRRREDLGKEESARTPFYQGARKEGTMSFRGTFCISILAVISGLSQARADALLVAEGDNSIHRLSLAGEDLGVFASRGLAGPVGLAADREGNIYVANSGDNTVHRFSPSGQDLGVFASEGLSVPVGLAFDSDGNLFVAGDTFIHRFSPSGEPLGLFVSLLGRGCTGAIAFAADDTLLAADGCRSVIRRFSPDGTELDLFASTGLTAPVAMIFDSDGNLLVANSDNAGPFRNTVRLFSPTGQDLGPFATEGLRFPGGLALLSSGDASSDLLVSNEEQRPGEIDYSIRRFSSSGEDLGDFVVLASQPRGLLLVRHPTPHQPPCHQHARRRSHHHESDH